MAALQPFVKWERFLSLRPFVVLALSISPLIAVCGGACSGVTFNISSNPTPQAQTATVNGNTVYQTIDGFGSQTWLFGDSLTGSNSSLFFSTSSGIGLSFARTANTFDGGIPDLATLQAAVANGASVELSLQSPPCSLKHSYVDLGEDCTSTGYGGDYGGQAGAFNDGTASSNGTCLTSSQSLATSFAAYATYIVDYINTLQGSPNNIPITYLDVQNEPDEPGSNNTGGLGYCNWTSGSQFDTFVGTYLGPALASAGLTAKIIMPSAEDWFATDFATTCLDDSTCSQYVPIVSGHGYDFPYAPTAYSLGTSSGHHLWMGETSAKTASDATMTTALVMAYNMYQFFTVANVSAYEWWELTYDVGDGNFGLTTCTGCGPGTSPTIIANKRLYVMGNWSKFVRPGQVMIAATGNPQSNVYVTAFKNSSTGSFEIVAINNSSGAITQGFTLTGLSASAVTPWITDPNNNLAAQSSVSVSSNFFSYSLTPNSVTTFVSR
jgi:glucuronoarabinoxylan endo-1,4-beta-xylanase